MIELASAQQRLLALVSNVSETRQYSLDQCLGLVVARDYLSSLAIPPQDNSAMDGFALSAIDSHSSDLLRISQRIPAGTSPSPLEAGTAARIFTGGVIPLGADAVVIQENCEFDQQQLKILKPVDKGENVRPSGQDIKPGAKIVAAGQKLSAIDLGLLASIGISQVECYAPITVAIFSTGDELAEPGQALRKGQIYNSNRPLLKGLCRQLGFEVYDCGVVEDSLQATKEALKDAAEHADFIISSGGVSVGEEDHVKPAVEALGRLDLWKIKMKPGKPVAFGYIDQTPFIGLPGNPVSSFVVFQLLGIPLLRKRQGQRAETRIEYSVVADFDKNLTTREEYIRVKLSAGEQGELRARCFPNLSSGVMSSLSWADGLVRQDADSGIERGQELRFLPLNGGVI